jgi:tetratricopeptide (TPR) repeat protein
MKQVWIASLTFVASATTALAQDEALPQAVGDAYLAYETALASNDHEVASEAAELAWRAAQDARIDRALIGVLAANYGDMAEAQGDHAAAYEARREAAEIAERLGDPAGDRFRLWYNAASSAYLAGDYSDAYRCAERADRHLADSDADNVSDSMRADHYLLAAQTGILARRSRDAASMADAGLPLVRERDGAGSVNYANLAFMSGVGETFRRDWVGCSVQMRQASAAFAGLDLETNQLVAEALQGMCIAYVDEDERWEMISRIQTSDHPDPDYDQVDALTGEVRWLRRHVPIPDPEWSQQYLSGAITLEYSVDRTGAATDIVVVENTLDGAIIPVVTEALEGFWFEPDREGLQRGAVRFEFDRGRYVDPDETGFRPVPLVRREPAYPYSAARSGEEGITVVRFSVDEMGRVNAPELIYEVPAGVFGEVTLEAVDSWTYAPVDPLMPAETRDGLVTFFHFRLRG